jgi:hypothetical protein
LGAVGFAALTGDGHGGPAQREDGEGGERDPDAAHGAFPP